MRPIPIQNSIIRSESPVVTAMFTDWMYRGIQHLTLCGPRRCSKSVHAILFTLWLIQHADNLKVCFLRSEASTLRRTIFRTFIDYIFAFTPGDKRNPFRVIYNPLQIIFENGAIIDFIGFDDQSKIQGGQYDVIFFNEIVREENPEKLSDLWGTLADASAGNLKLNGQNIGLFLSDCNPSTPYHWYYKRFFENREAEPGSRWYKFSHTEHPLHYDWKRKLKLPAGIQTRNNLLRAYPPGPERDRMVFGEWSGAKGRVYSMYLPDRHVIPMHRTDAFFKKCEWDLAIDFGGGEAHAVGLFAVQTSPQTYSNRYRLYKEIYVSQITIQKLIEHIDIMLMTEGLTRDDISVCVTDHLTENYLQLIQAGFPVVLANKDIISGVDCGKRVIADERFHVNQDSLIDIHDPHLIDKIRGFKQEVLQFRYRTEGELLHNLSDNKPAPKQIKHSMDLFRYEMKYREEVMEYPMEIQPLESFHGFRMQ